MQIILEAGLLKDQDEHEIEEKIGHSNVKEIRLICGYLHESFIADPTLAKLVHFQVSCFDFIITKLQKPNIYHEYQFIINLICQILGIPITTASYNCCRCSFNAHMLRLRT